MRIDPESTRETWSEGDRAKCVDARHCGGHLVAGHTYVVTAVVTAGTGRWAGMVGYDSYVSLRLAGCVNPVRPDDGWHAGRFVKRPPLVREQEVADDLMIPVEECES